MPNSPVPPGSADPRHWERWAVGLVLACFVAVSIHAVGNAATAGQDHIEHYKYTRQILDHPGTWLVENSTCRPLLYWIGALCILLVGDPRGFQLASILFALGGAAALALLHDASRRAIHSPLVRTTGIAFLAFLPLTVVTTVVYAGDTVASLPFVLAGWCLVRCLESDSDGKALFHASLAGAALAAGAFARATFVVLPAAVVLVLLALWRAGRLTPRRGWTVFLLVALLPGIIGGWLADKAARQFADAKPVNHFVWRGAGELAFLVKPSDGRILDAPGFFDGRAGFILPNNYSYPALLHLSIFTDFLDFTQNAHRQIPRPAPQSTYSRWSVRLGLVFSLGAFAAVAAFWVRTLAGIARPRGMPTTATLTWSALAMVWYAPFIATLPFVTNVNIWGYWLPRYVMPSLWIFFLSLFAALDRLPGKWRTPCSSLAAVLVLVLGVTETMAIWYPWTD